MELIKKLLHSLNALKRSKFIKDVSIIAGGTATAQLIAIAFTPLITRLYSPDAFGILGVFVSFTGLTATVANLNYSQAIVIPATDFEAKVLVKLSFIVTFLFFFISMIVVGTFYNQIACLIGFDVSSVYLLLSPIVVLFISCEQIFTQWLIRKRQFNVISIIDITQAVFKNTLMSSFGFIASSAPVLIILNSLAHFFHSALLWLKTKPLLTISKLNGFKENAFYNPGLIDVAVNFRDFPFYNSPTRLLNTISQNLPLLLIAALFDSIAAGHYALTMRVLRVPSAFISDSVGKVFYPKIAEAANRDEKLQPLIIKATLALLLIGILPFGALVYLGPWLFSLIFGSEWILAGEYARWLSILFFLQFINKPSVRAIPILGLQKYYLALEVIASAIRITTIFYGAIYFNNVLFTIALFSLSGAIFYLGLILWVIACSRNSKRN